MSQHQGSYTSASNLFLYTALVVVFAVVYLILPPVRGAVYGIRCIIVSAEVKLFDKKLSEEIGYAGRVLLKTPSARYKRVNIDMIKEKYLAPRFEVAKKYTRIYSIAVFLACFIYIYRMRKDTPPYKKGIREFLADKYGVNVSKTTDCRNLKSLMDNIKQEKNLPVNLVARLFPKNSPERLYIYKGREDYEIQEITV